jgi:tetratricopeptide (TPR) repeat protein
VLKDKGDEAMEAARPAEALPAYEAALAACGGAEGAAAPHGASEGRAALLYNLGRTHLALGDYAKALALFEEFQRAAPPAVIERVPGLEQLIEEQRRRVGALSVSCNVRGATIRVRERSVGQAPLPSSLRLSAGRALVEVSAEGYVTFTKVVELPAGALTKVEATLVPRVQVGTLAVRSSVEDALVFLDGQPYGKAPVESRVPVGAHRVLVRLEGYRDADQQVALAQGERKELTLTPERITPITGRWWFWTTVGAVVAAGAVTTIVAVTSERASEGGNLGAGTIVAGASHPFTF